MSSCYACLIEKSESPISNEHFFPEMIGGRKAFPILCVHHNSNTGAKIDPALIEIFQPFRVFLGLVPITGEKPKEYNAIKFRMGKDGEEFLLDGRGDAFLRRPKFNMTKTSDDKLQIHIKASTKRESDLQLHQLKRKYPKLDASNIQCFSENENTSGLLYSSQVRLSSDGLKRAIAKMAIGYAVGNGVTPEIMRAVIDYSIFGFPGSFVSHANGSLTDCLNIRKFNHTITLIGSSEERLLASFIELFGCASFIILLSDSYQDQDIFQSYSIDPIEGKAADCKVRATLTRTNFFEAFKPDEEVPDSFIECFNKGLGIAIERQHTDREISQAVEKSLAFLKSKGHEHLTFANYPVFEEHFISAYILPRIRRRA